MKKKDLYITNNFILANDQTLTHKEIAFHSNLKLIKTIQQTINNLINIQS